MKWRACAGLLALLAAGCTGMPQHSGAVPEAAQMRAEPDRLILLTVANPPESVASRAGSTLRGYDTLPAYTTGDSASATVAALARDYGLREMAAWPIVPLHVHCVVFEIPQLVTRQDMIDRLMRDPRVKLAQPMQTFATRSTSYNDPYIGLQRGFARIDAADAQQWSQGAGVRVAIIDTGVDAAHPDLKDRVTMERNFVDAGSAQFNRDRHGTEIAGVIAAVANNREGIVGIAPGASVLALKACWQLKPQADEAQCNSFTLAQALTVAIESSAQVVNLSLGGPADPLLSQLVEYGLQQGIIFVGAVPPDGGMSGFPVGVPGVIAVDVSGRAAGDAQVLHAPGREILTLTPGGHYDFASGSSIAAAHVTGVVALLLAQDAHLNAAAAYALLSRSSTSTADDRRDNVSINACVALTALRLHGSCDQTAAPSATAADASGATALKAEH